MADVENEVQVNRRANRSEPYVSSMEKVGRAYDQFINRYTDPDQGPIRLETEHGYASFGSGRNIKAGIKKKF